MEPIQTSSIPEAIVQRIIQMIGDGVWKAGDQLPSQRQLAQELNVGFSSLREALQTLQGMGVLELRHGQGTFVCHNPSQIVERCLNLALVLEKDMMTDFMDARRTIEGGLAFLAARRATPEQIQRLGVLLDGLKDAIDAGNNTRVEEFDIPFHHLIAEMSASTILQFLSNSLFETLEEFIRIVPHTPKGWQHHAQVYLAIKARDSAGSERAMHELVDATAKYLHFLQSNGKQALSI